MFRFIIQSWEPTIEVGIQACFDQFFDLNFPVENSITVWNLFQWRSSPLKKLVLFRPQEMRCVASLHAYKLIQRPPYSLGSKILVFVEASKTNLLQNMGSSSQFFPRQQVPTVSSSCFETYSDWSPLESRYILSPSWRIAFFFQ